MVKGFLALREHAEEIISFVEMSMVSGIDLPCFRGRDRVLSELRERFQLEMSDAQCKAHIIRLIEEACDCWRTRWYDKFQKYSADVWWSDTEAGFINYHLIMRSKCKLKVVKNQSIRMISNEWINLRSQFLKITHLNEICSLIKYFRTCFS